MHFYCKDIFQSYTVEKYNRKTDLVILGVGRTTIQNDAFMKHLLWKSWLIHCSIILLKKNISSVHSLSLHFELEKRVYYVNATFQLQSPMRDFPEKVWIYTSTQKKETIDQIVTSSEWRGLSRMLRRFCNNKLLGFRSNENAFHRYYNSIRGYPLIWSSSTRCVSYGWNFKSKRNFFLSKSRFIFISDFYLCTSSIWWCFQASLNCNHRFIATESELLCRASLLALTLYTIES